MKDASSVVRLAHDVVPITDASLPVQGLTREHSMIIAFYKGVIRFPDGKILHAAWGVTPFGIRWLSPGMGRVVHTSDAVEIATQEQIAAFEVLDLERDAVELIVDAILRGGYLDKPGVKDSGDAVLFMLANEAIHRLEEMSGELSEKGRHVMDMKAGSSDAFPELLAEGLWVLGNYYFNLYLVRGEQASALIEVGVSGVVDEVIRQLHELAVKPDFLVVTHPHSDHVTGLPGLEEAFPEAVVVAAEGAAEFLAHPKATAALVAEDRHMTDFLASQGLSPGRPPVREAPGLEGCRIVGDGDEIDLGGLRIRFLAVRGHSPGKFVVHIPEIGALILSDSFGFRFPGRGVLPLFLTNYEDYMATLDRLEALDASILGPAHQGPVLGADVGAAFDEARQIAADLRKKILEDSRDPEEIAQELFEEYYKDELLLYTRKNMRNCATLVVRRAKE